MNILQAFWVTSNILPGVLQEPSHAPNVSGQVIDRSDGDGFELFHGALYFLVLFWIGSIFPGIPATSQRP